MRTPDEIEREASGCAPGIEYHDVLRLIRESRRAGREEMREEIARYVAPLDRDTGLDSWSLACEIRALPIDDEATK